MGNIEPKKKSRFKKNIDVLKLPKKTYKTAKKIAKKGLSKSNLALASGLDIFLEKEIGVRKQFFGFLNFIPHKIRKYSKILFPLALMFLILKWDLPIPIDIKKAFALFICIGLLWGLESLPMVVTAIMVPVLIVLLGLGNQTEALSSFSNPVIYLLFGGLILAVAFRKNGLDRRFAFKLLSLSGGDSKKILFYFMLSSAVLGMWMSNTATVALLVPIAISISSYIKKEDNKKFISVLILCIGIGSSIGGMSAITGSTPNAITSAFINENNIFSFSQWMQIGVPISVICFMSAYFLLINMFKIKSKNIIENSKEFFKIDEPLTYNQKKTIAIFLPTIIFWIFGKDIAIYFNLNPNIFS